MLIVVYTYLFPASCCVTLIALIIFVIKQNHLFILSIHLTKGAPAGIPSGSGGPRTGLLIFVTSDNMRFFHIWTYIVSLTNVASVGSKDRPFAKKYNYPNTTNTQIVWMASGSR